MIDTNTREGFAFRHKEDHLWLKIGAVGALIEEPYIQYAEYPSIDMASVYSARNTLEDDLLKIFYMLTRFSRKNNTDVLKASRFRRENWEMYRVEVVHKVIERID